MMAKFRSAVQLWVKRASPVNVIKITSGQGIMGMAENAFSGCSFLRCAMSNLYGIEKNERNRAESLIPM